MSGISRELPKLYGEALAVYLASPSEDGLMHAYELGRRALSRGIGVAQLGNVHGEALIAALAGADSDQARTELTRRAGQFLAETLAPVEMILRGYQGANAQLSELNQTLEQRVEERTAALREIERRKDEFQAVLAHELRNLLAPLRTGLQILRLENHVADAELEVFDIMERQIQHLVRLVDDLMDVTRITRGKIELRPVRTDLNTLVHAAVEASRPLIDEAGHTLHLDLPAEPLVLECDETRISQIVVNLLNNAAKYTHAGGRIWVAAERQGDEAVLRVRDTGVGIPREMLQRVFDMFTQGDRSSERSRSGLGIGLTLVRRLVEMHGGSVQALSDGPGHGAEFIVRLPLATPGDDALPPDVPQELGARTRRTTHRVLVVDDDEASARSLAMLLKRMGNDARIATDGPSALVLARSYRPDVILLDIAMPGMNGFEVARRLRQDPECADVLLVALTGWGQDEDRRRAREAGFELHLVKPAAPHVLRTLLNPPTIPGTVAAR